MADRADEAAYTTAYRPKESAKEAPPPQPERRTGASEVETGGPREATPTPWERAETAGSSILPPGSRPEVVLAEPEGRAEPTGSSTLPLGTRPEVVLAEPTGSMPPKPKELAELGSSWTFPPSTRPEMVLTEPACPTTRRPNEAAEFIARTDLGPAIDLLQETENTEAPAAPPHFAPQHWLLCHMGLY